MLIVKRREQGVLIIKVWLKQVYGILVLAGGYLLLSCMIATPLAAAQDPVGLTATVVASAPTESATITVPTNGQTFIAVPITVSGTCPSGLLIKLFKNNVFGGSAMCSGGKFSLKIDLFNGKNDLIARVYDALDQAGPDSNTVSVTYSASSSKVSVTTDYAKRGANPGETLVWPIVVSGGNAPYAISVDWGDIKLPDLISMSSAGSLELSHIYDFPGVYDVLIRVSDRDADTAYLHVVGVGNGPLEQSTGDQASSVIIRTRVLWWPILIPIPLIIIAYWRAKKREKKRIKDALLKGENPLGLNNVLPPTPPVE